MPSMLTKMFEPEAQDGETQSGQSSDTSLAQDLQAAADLEVEVTIRTETSIEYQSGDESGGWSNSSEVTLTAGVDALLGSATDADFGQATHSE